MVIIISSTLLEETNMKLKKLKMTLAKLFKWFHENSMKANQDKCYFLSRIDETKHPLYDCLTENSSSEKHQRVKIDNMLQICAI